MTENERRKALQNAISYWMPQAWPYGSVRYTIISLTYVGDVDSGSVDVYVDKDGDAAVIQFTNEECYGETPLTPSAAIQRVYDAVYA